MVVLSTSGNKIVSDKTGKVITMSERNVSCEVDEWCKESNYSLRGQVCDGGGLSADRRHRHASPK